MEIETKIKESYQAFSIQEVISNSSSSSNNLENQMTISQNLQNLSTIVSWMVWEALVRLLYT